MKQVLRSVMVNHLFHDVLYDVFETVTILSPVLLNQDEDKIENELCKAVITKILNFLECIIFK